MAGLANVVSKGGPMGLIPMMMDRNKDKKSSSSAPLDLNALRSFAPELVRKGGATSTIAGGAGNSGTYR